MIWPFLLIIVILLTLILSVLMGIRGEIVNFHRSVKVIAKYRINKGASK